VTTRKRDVKAKTCQRKQNDRKKGMSKERDVKKKSENRNRREEKEMPMEGDAKSKR